MIFKSIFLAQTQKIASVKVTANAVQGDRKGACLQKYQGIKPFFRAKLIICMNKIVRIFHAVNRFSPFKVDVSLYHKKHVLSIRDLQKK